MMNEAHDMSWDETARGGSRHGHNKLSFPKTGRMYKATEGVWPWAPPGDHENDNRMCLPSAYVEGLFGRAPVPDPDGLKQVKFMVKCLDTSWMAPALQKLLDAGLTTTLNDDGEEVEKIFLDINQIYSKANELMKTMLDDPEMEVTEESWEWLEDYDGTAAEAGMAWFYPLDLCEMTKDTKNLETYIDLNFHVGPRSTKDVRLELGGTFYSLITGEGGGQLGHAIQNFFYRHQRDRVMAPAFLLRRLVDFLRDSAWPEVYKHHYTRWEDYAFDLPNRALWKTATRQEWMSIVQNKLPRSIQRELPTLAALYGDYLTLPVKLSREIQLLGDLVLKGDDAQKMPFFNIEQVEALLLKDYGELITAEVDVGASTEIMIQKVVARATAMKSGSKTPEGPGDDTGLTQGPKPGQMARAFGVTAYVQLEVKYMEPLQSRRMTMVEELNMIAACLTAKTVLPHTVLFATKGARIAVYIGQTGSDFLALVYGKRHMMLRYVGQSLAYDIELKSVPSSMKNFEFDAKEWEKIADFEWDQLDFFNGCFLKLMGAEVGTQFHTVSVKNLYHRGDMLIYVQDVYGRLFQCLGYPTSVLEDEGWTFREFLGRLRRLQKFAIALTPEEQRGAHELIDEYKSRGFTAASQEAKRLIYGPSPADQQLGPFILRSDSVYSDIQDTLEALTDTATWRRRMGAICGKKVHAATPDGFATTSASGGGSSSDPGSSKRQRNKKNKSVSFGAGTKAGQVTSTTPRGGSNKSPKAKANSGGTTVKEKGKVGDGVNLRNIFPYDDGTFSIGARPTNRTGNRAQATNQRWGRDWRGWGTPTIAVPPSAPPHLRPRWPS